MNDAVLITDYDFSDSSNLGNNSSHRHRHHHQDHANSNSEASKSRFILPDAGNYTDPLGSNSLYDQPKRDPTNAQNDNGFYSGIFSGQFNKPPQLSGSSMPTTNYTSGYTSPTTNHTLTFHTDVRSNSTRPNTTTTDNFKNAYYSYYDVSNSNNNDNNSNNANSAYGPEYQQYDVVPFNTDTDSDAPHFDAEFFPEPLDPLDSDRNGTIISAVPDLLDPFPHTPWGSSPDNSGNLPHHAAGNNNNNFNNISNLHPFLTPNITSLVFDNVGKVHSDYDYALPSVNATTVFGSDYTTSSANSSGAISADDVYTWSILIMAPLVIFGVAGNTLVILAISLEKRLQNVTNYFLLSLAVTDLLVSLIVMPLSIINVLTGRWLLGLYLCDFFVTADVLMCTSSILHLCTISLERYIGIRYPLWTKNKSKRVVLLKIVLVWTIALAISSPITVLGVIKEENVLVDGECVLSNEHFIIYGSIFAFYIPLAIMVLMYALTVRMLNKQARLCHSRRADDGEGQPMIRRSTSRRNWQHRRQYYGRESLSATNSYCTTRITEPDGTGPPMATFHQRYRPLGVSRHNTIPLCHHHHNQHGHRHNDNSRRDAGGGGGGGTTVNGGGSNNSINSIHRGRGNNNNATGANNNNNNSNNGNVEGNTTASIGMNRRNRFANQNGTGTAVYIGRSPAQDLAYCNGHQEDIATDLTSDSQNCCSSRLSSSSSSSSPTSSTNREPKRLRELVRKHHVAVKAANILLMKREGQNQNQSQTPTPSSSTYASVRRDNSVRTEQKASKVLGVVFMIFVICWAPFFTVNILTVLCTESCKFEPTLITAFVWLGYVSSTLNPIIYTIFNNIFRITFIKLLCCRYRLLHRARRSSTMPGIRNGILSCSSFCPAPVTNINNPNPPSNSYVDESQC